MMKRLLIPLAALSLSGCALLPALLGGIAPPPVQVANQTTLDEKGAIAVETLYATFARAGALAYRTRLIAPSSNPAVQRDDFCQLVLRREFIPTDRGADLAAIECRMRSARDAARAAYDAGNATNYAVAFAAAMAAYNEGMTLVRGE